ncbi:hypothetical protein BDQ17DRAFT_1422751 [Cyathus striatus]|nr:hypothetical protein BDQ17DRAFT_1422751 [Cyathus striatus]
MECVPPQYTIYPQWRPDFISRRFDCPATSANNVSMVNIVATLITNGVPIAWIDYVYLFGLNYLDAHFTNSPLRRDLFLDADDRRLEWLQYHGEPQEITKWSGFWSPSPEDFDHIYTLMWIDQIHSRAPK